MNKHFIERFWEKVVKGQNNCWNYCAGKSTDGYGMFHLGKKDHGAHRISWIIHFGEIPKGMFVYHKCDNPICVNPDHLFLGTPLDNTRDMIKKGRDNKAFGEKHGMSKLTNAIVSQVKKDHASGISLYSLGKKHGVSRQTLYAIVRNETWKHVID